jgi:hypothetical protein
LKLNRDQLRWVVGLFTGHCHSFSNWDWLMTPFVKGA